MTDPRQMAAATRTVSSSTRSAPGAWSRLVLVVAAALLVAVACAPDAPPAAITFGITPEQHDTHFRISGNAPHAGLACTSCHGDGASFRVFTCVGCHTHDRASTDGIHAGLPAYRYDDASCYGCHPKGSVDDELVGPEGHERYFPIGAGAAHAAVRCAQCPTNPDDRRVVGCTSCHEHAADPMAALHAGMTSYAWDSPTCLTCHPRADNPGALDHTFFPTSTGSVHAGLSCASCHAQQTDRSVVACTTCHTHEQAATDAQHAGVPDYAWDSSSCVLCHPGAEVPGVMQHGYFPIDAGARHALGATIDTPATTISCATCHQDPTNSSVVSCTSCHAHDEPVLAPIHAAIPGYQWGAATCLLCHPGGEATGLVEHDAFFPTSTGTPHAGLSCTSCHASTTDRTLLSCTSCHEHRIDVVEPPHRGLPGYAYDSAACFACHARAQVPGVVDHEPFFPIASPSVHTGLSCADCHASQTDRTQIRCTSCHTGTHDEAPMATTHGNVPGYSWSPASCLGCHPTGSADNVVVTHPYFPIGTATTHEVKTGGASCTDCHTNANDYTVVSCTTCHTGTHDEAPMTTRHAAVPGFAWSTAQCLFCHPNGEASGNIDHDRYFPIAGANVAHAGIACAQCHTDANNRSVVDCAGCHAADNPTPVAVHAGIPGFSNTSPTCLTCHPRAEPTGRMDHSAYFPITSGTAHGGSAYAGRVTSTQTACTACHASRTDRSANLCSTCHENVAPAPTTTHTRVGGFANNSTNCKQCHADAQVDPLSAHTRISPRHHGSKCVDCHQTSRTDKPWGINFTRAVCTRCHSASCTIANQGPCN